MSKSQISACLLILEEHFGELVQKVGAHLLERGVSPLKIISAETGLKLDQVKKIITLLIQQNIVTFEPNKKGFIEYSISWRSILLRTRFASFIYCAKTLYGDAAELLVEDILQKGQALMRDAIKSVTEKLNDALEASGHQKISSSLVGEKFVSLVKTHFLQQCFEPVKDESEKVISLCPPVDSEELFQVPPMHMDGETSRKRKRSEEGLTQPLKKRKEDMEDDQIYWRVNVERFHHHFRDQAIISAVAKKIDRKASEVMRTMLRVSEVKTHPYALVTMPISINEILPALPKDLNISKQILEQCLSVLCDDSAKFVKKSCGSSGGMYSVIEVLVTLCKAHIESVVQERFGSKSLRIFRILLLKKHLEQKQIEEFAMIPAKEVKELLYNMLSHNFVTVTELPKAPDHAPSRTYYLFTVNITQLAQMLLERANQAFTNAILRRQHEVKEHRRLLDKQQRVEAIIASLDQNGVEESQKEEVEQTITPAEKAQLVKVKHDISQLHQCEIQLEETIFIFETYLHYCREQNITNK